jgi:outer membrane receptor for ferrienterochelin and colicins
MKPKFNRLLPAIITLTTPLLSAQVSTPDAFNTLEPLVVTAATRTERMLTDVPIRTEVILAEDIALRAPLNFSQAVELSNGVRVESNCQNCNTSEVQLLGLPGAYNQILFNGIPLLSTLGGVYGLEQIPVSFVDRLEMVKGGGSALYGPGAVAGVINLVTAEPTEAGGFTKFGVDVQESEPLYQFDVRLDAVSSPTQSARFGKFAASVVGQFSSNDEIDFNSDGFSEITRKELSVGGIQLWYAPLESTRLRADYTYTDEERRGGDQITKQPHLTNITEFLDTRYHRASFAWEQDITPDFGFTASYSYADIARDSFYGGLSGRPVNDPLLIESLPGAGDNEQSLLDLGYNTIGEVAEDQYGYTENPLHFIDLLFRQNIGDHALAYGVQYKHESIFDEKRDFTGASVGTPIIDESFSDLGFLIQDEWTVNDRLDLVLGARVDDASTVDNLIFSPRIAAAYDATNRLKLRASFSTGFRAPDVFSEDLHIDTLGGVPIPVVNSPNLTEESSQTFQVGFDLRSESDDAIPWSWDVTAAYTEIKDTFLLTRIGSGVTAVDLRENGSGSTILGLETNLSIQPDPTFNVVFGLAAYSSRFNSSEDVFADGATVLSTRDYLKTPSFSGVIQGVWSPTEDWDIVGGLKFTGSMDVLNNRTATINRTDSFFAVDLGLVRHISLNNGKHLDLSVGVKNIFDQRQNDLEVGAARDSDYVYGPRFARSFYAQVRYEF